MSLHTSKVTIPRNVFNKPRNVAPGLLGWQNLCINPSTLETHNENDSNARLLCHLLWHSLLGRLHHRPSHGSVVSRDESPRLGWPHFRHQPLHALWHNDDRRVLQQFGPNSLHERRGHRRHFHLQPTRHRGH